MKTLTDAYEDLVKHFTMIVTEYDHLINIFDKLAQEHELHRTVNMAKFILQLSQYPLDLIEE